MMRLTLRQLQIFTAVADAGALAPAARRLRLSQPTLSEALRDLEAVLGVALFDRSARPLLLTAAGRALAPEAKELLQRAEMLQRRHARRPRLSCGASVTLGNHILPPSVIAFRRRHPEVIVDLVIGNTAQVARLVLEREVQIGVVEGRVAHPDLSVTSWRQDALVIVAPPDHPALLEPTPEVLASLPWVLREPGSGTRESFDAWTAAWPTPPQIALTAGGNTAIIAAVAAGLGLSCLSGAAVAGEIARGVLARAPVYAPELIRTLSLVQRRDARPDQALAAFLDVLEEAPGG
jgi:DNA-binding transcriptional LysR family regulator